MNRKLSLYENDLIKHLIHDTEKIEEVSTVINYKFIQKENKYARAVFWALNSIYNRQGSFTNINIEVEACKLLPDSDGIIDYIEYVQKSLPENTIKEDIAYILQQNRKENLTIYVNKINNELSLEYPNFGLISNIIEKIENTLEYRVEEIEDDNILVNDPVIEFKEPTLQRLFGGVLRGNLTTLAGDTGHTKTTMSIFMTNEWLENGYKVLSFPIDGNRREFLQKLCALRARINSHLIIESNFTKENPYGKMTKEEYEKVKNELNNIKERFIKTNKLVIKDKVTSLPEMRLWIRKEKPDIVIIDTIQGMDMPAGDSYQNPAMGTPIILKSLKQISKQINCAIILVAWMSTEGKRPKTWMMYATKAMDRWSSKIWMLYYYYKVEQIPSFKNIVEVISGKERFSSSKISLVSFIPQYGIYKRLDAEKTLIKNYSTITKLKINKDLL